MGKQNTTKSGAGAPDFNLEEFQKLTPEQQAKYAADFNEKAAAYKAQHDALASENEGLKSANDKLNDKLKAKAKETPKEKGLPSIEVEEDEDAEIEGGEYQFTSPSFTWDDNSVISVADLVAAAQGKDVKKQQKAQVIIASLLKRKSGILEKKGGPSDE